MIIDKNSLENEKQPSCLGYVSSRACQFAEWLQEKRWFSYYQGKWNYTFEQETSISEKIYNKNYRKTTQELYVKFC